MSQLGLLGDESEPTLHKLGERQQLVLEALEQAPMTADDAGAIIHANRGRHPTDQRCQWCAKEGGQVLRSLRKHGLVIRRRAGEWEIRGAQGSGSASPVSPSADAYNQFPDGF